MNQDEKNKVFDERLIELERLMDGLKNASQTNPDIAKTLGLILTGTSAKSASAENQAVNESGSGTYSVLKPPDRFIRIGNTNVPAYD